MYMEATSTHGAIGTAHVGIDTLANAMANWSIPEQFRAQAVQSVNLLVIYAIEGSHSAQAFVFDTKTGGALSTLLVVVNRLDSPTDQNLPVAVSYVMINSNAAVKQQYTSYDTQRCHKCAKCLWLSSCCCHTVTEYSSRGNTPEELSIIKQKLTADQYIWFTQQSLSNTVKEHVLTQNESSKSNVTLHEAIEHFLSNNLAKAEVLASYNDSILSALQSNTAALKLTSQSLKLKKIASENVRIVLSVLSKDYDFDDISTDAQFLQQFQSGRFSYENFFTTSSDNDREEIEIKYIWIVGQKIDNISYSINFLSVNITSQGLINTLLVNHTNDDLILKIVRFSILSDHGQFLNEYLSTSITPWKTNITKIALNILRYTAASVLIPQKHRMLSYFDSLTNSTMTSQPSRNRLGISEKIVALSNAISAGAKAWTDIVNAFKSSSSTTITRITRFGFNHFAQKSTVLKAINIPADRATEFINAVTIDYDLPSKGSFTLGLTYSEDFAWDRIDFLYSPSMNGTYRSLTLFKNGDSLSDTASFFIVDINADWQLAPDLLIIQSSRSILGGLFQKNRQSIQEVPHVLTMEEAIQLKDFFMLVALNNIASTLKVNVTLPALE